LSNATLNKALDDIEKGLIGEDGKPIGQRYSAANRATNRAVWKVVQRHCSEKTDAQCKEIILTWTNARSSKRNSTRIQWQRCAIDPFSNAQSNAQNLRAR
jgi:hypothetical protein